MDGRGRTGGFNPPDVCEALARVTTDSSASLGTRCQVVGEVKTGVRRVLPVSSYSKEGCTFHLSKPSRSLWRCRLPFGSGTDPQSFPEFYISVRE